ncbi:MAG TPA: sigma-70 family RNA polymerase sigma factor [Candidatus Angelobacter sp.]
MNVHISYKAGKTPDVEREFQNQLQKLQRRLQVFKPDLVHFHAIVEQEKGYGAGTSLNLRLPSGQMAVQKKGENPVAAVKTAFTDLLSQLTKHKELLRGEWAWKRRRGSGRRQMGQHQALLEVASSTVKSPPVHGAEKEGGDISEWVNANLRRLERFVDRELRYRVATGQIREEQISRDEVIDEVMVSALSHEEEKPDELSMESWLYRLALQAVRRLALTNADTATVSLDAPAGTPNVTGSDENVLQYHQPDDSLQEESIIRNDSARTPEEIFASEEMIGQLDLVLHGVSAQAREAFVLFTLEGFTVDEIARITDQVPDRIRKSIQQAREQIRQKLPAHHELRQRLLNHSRVA